MGLLLETSFAVLFPGGCLEDFAVELPPLELPAELPVGCLILLPLGLTVGLAFLAWSALAALLGDFSDLDDLVGLLTERLLWLTSVLEVLGLLLFSGDFLGLAFLGVGAGVFFLLFFGALCLLSANMARC